MNKQGISKQELINTLKKFKSQPDYDESNEYTRIEYYDAIQSTYDECIDLATQLSEPSECGECEILETERNDYASDFTCSNCNKHFDLFRYVYFPKSSVNYCPSCGAKIKRSDNGEDTK